jgi:hypothetical protein
MNWLIRLSGTVLMVALILPSWGQDAKKDDKPAADKKADKKADADNKDAKKADAKKKDAKKSKTKSKSEDAQAKEKISFGQMVYGKLKQIDANSNRDFTVAVMVPDAKKIYDANIWAAQNITLYQQQQMFNIGRMDPRNPVAKAQALANFQMTLTQRQMEMAQKDLLSPKDYELRAVENIKIRTATPPTEYDEKGNMKRWSMKELENLKKGSKLPGYPAEFDALRPGQLVAIYLAKKELPSATKDTKTKGIKIDQPKGIKINTNKTDDDTPMEMKRPEVVMIVVVQDVAPGQRE